MTNQSDENNILNVCERSKILDDEFSLRVGEVHCCSCETLLVVTRCINFLTFCTHYFEFLYLDNICRYIDYWLDDYVIYVNNSKYGEAINHQNLLS
jgi:hypothetical protein